MKRSIILYGAFDRYNYGDNLMPILFEMYMKKFHNEVLSDCEFIYSSIQDSDLSNYRCKPTVSMSNLLNVNNYSSVVVVGGEVLGADVGILYTHVQNSLFKTKMLRYIRKLSPSLLMKIAKNNYEAVWDYPYIPNKNSFSNNVKVIFNTVGGNPPASQREQIVNADYISARDNRTLKHLSMYSKPNLVPDSVLMASSVINDDFFDSVVRQEIKDLAKNDFISVQACPYKVGFSPKQMAVELEKTSLACSVNIVLLPIGYASGHDDIVFLRKVNACVDNKFILLDELNVWEIMYVISKSKAFFGTSLHGVITAMSFLVPHFSINNEIEKLTSFLKTWSIVPYNNPISVCGIENAVNLSKKQETITLKKAVEKAQSLIFSSLDDISKIL